MTGDHMKMSMMLIAAILLVAFPSIAGLRSDMVRADAAYPFNILHSSGVSAAKADTVYLLGGPDRDDGDFQDQWAPTWEGWFGVDLTQSTDSKWHVDTYNSPTGTAALWCGEMIPSCGEGDVDGGYGNNYEELIVWTGAVADPASPTDVTVTMTMNYDTEADYDFLHLQYEAAAGWTSVAQWDGTNAVDGVFVPVDEAVDFTVASGDLQDGAVSLRLRAYSDGAYSDQDCLFTSAGFVQIDDLGVSGTNGLPTTFDDFESGLDGANWTPALAVGVGDFAKVWPLLEPPYPCFRNRTPQVAFIDDGVVEPCTGGTIGTTWTYGPGGYVVNTTGGCAGSDHHLQNEIWSPPIAWSDPVTGAPLGASHQGASFEWDVFDHGNWDAGIYRTWAVRSSNDGGGTWTPWVNRNFIYYQDYIGRERQPVLDFMASNPTHVQLALGINEFGWVWGFNGDDSTPAPFYDNVAFKVYPIEGPSITTRELELAQDNFPEIGAIDYTDLGANSIRFDMAKDVMRDAAPSILPGDSITFSIQAVRPGAVLTGLPGLAYTMKANPLFDPYRLHPTSGVVLGDSVRTAAGTVVPDRYAFDLPDADFFFPGDVIHYYIFASDDAGGDVRGATLPSDLAGFGVYPDDPAFVPHVWSSSFTVRGLPTLRSATPGDQPPILFYNDFGGRGGENEWVASLKGLGYVEGEDYDVYYVNAPTSGVSNGLGSRATASLIAGYQTMLYTSGSLSFDTLNRHDQFDDKSDDLSLLDAWLATGRNILLTGNRLASDLNSGQGVEGTTFLSTWMSVGYDYGDVGDLLGDAVTPGIAPVPGNTLGLETAMYADGSCPRLYQFDSVTPEGSVEVFAKWEGYAGLEAAGFLNTRLGSRVAYMPVAFEYLGTPASAAKTTVAPAARTVLLDRVLTLFGEAPSGVPSGVDSPIPARLAISAAPNPFNPSTTIAYAVPARGPVSVLIYDVKGRLVRTLIDDDHEPGAYTAVWNGRSESGAEAASGIYFTEVRTSSESRVEKLALIK